MGEEAWALLPMCDSWGLGCDATLSWEALLHAAALWKLGTQQCPAGLRSLSQSLHWLQPLENETAPDNSIRGLGQEAQ